MASVIDMALTFATGATLVVWPVAVGQILGLSLAWEAFLLRVIGGMCLGMSLAEAVGHLPDRWAAHDRPSLQILRRLGGVAVVKVALALTLLLGLVTGDLHLSPLGALLIGVVAVAMLSISVARSVAGVASIHPTYLAKTAMLVRCSRRIWAAVLALLLAPGAAVVFCYLLYLEVSRDYTVVEPFSVASELAERGYTGLELGRGLIGATNRIHRDALTRAPRPDIGSHSEAPAVEIEIGGAKVSLPSLVRYFRSRGVGRAVPTVSAGLSVQGDTIRTTVHVSGAPDTTFAVGIAKSDTASAVQQCLEGTALAIVRHVDPYVAAVHYFALDNADTGGDSRELLTNALQNARQDDDALAYGLLGKVHQTRGDTAEAERLLRVALTLDPLFAVAWSNLGQVFATREMNDSAVVCYSKALKYYPVSRPESLDYLRKGDYVNTYTNLGGALRKLGRYVEAREALQKAISWNDFLGNRRMSHPHYALGLTLENQGEPDSALKAYRQALDVSHQYYLAPVGSSRVHFAAGRSDSALRYLRTAREIIGADSLRAKLRRLKPGLCDSTYKLFADSALQQWIVEEPSASAPQLVRTAAGSR